MEKKIVTDAQVTVFARATAPLDNLVEKHAAPMAADRADFEAGLA